MKILVLEPYYGGSHKVFLQKLIKFLPYEFTLLTLPARKWKWRMRLAALFFSEKLKKMDAQFDRVFCSTFVDVALLRSTGPVWLQNIPVLTYFHENQFAYPVQVDDERDYHFSVTNFTTALVSSRLAFNSIYNLETFLKGIRELIKKCPDLKFNSVEGDILEKSTVISPGIDFTAIDKQRKSKITANTSSTPVLIWNHRWEHDKDPDLFFNTLFELDFKGVDFRLIILGQSFVRQPEIFSNARKKLAHKTIHFGYISSKQEYDKMLCQGDFVISTAKHEFFGMAVIEAVRAGCRPLLPNNLSYPGLFPSEYLYDEKYFNAKLNALLSNEKRLTTQEANTLTDRFSWTNLKEEYQKWFEKE